MTRFGWGRKSGVRLSAFNLRTTPELLGRVEQVSADAFTDEASLVSYYRAQVALLDGETGPSAERADADTWVRQSKYSSILPSELRWSI